MSVHRPRSPFLKSCQAGSSLSLRKAYFLYQKSQPRVKFTTISHPVNCLSWFLSHYSVSFRKKLFPIPKLGPDIGFMFFTEMLMMTAHSLVGPFSQQHAWDTAIYSSYPEQQPGPSRLYSRSTPLTSPQTPPSFTILRRFSLFSVY